LQPDRYEQSILDGHRTEGWLSGWDLRMLTGKVAYGLDNKRDFMEVWGQAVQVEGKARNSCRDWEDQCVQGMTADFS